MTKKELIDALAKQANLTFKQAEEVFKTTFQLIQQAMIQNGKVMVSEFGTFTTKLRAERKGRNPQTGKEIVIPKSTAAVFKPSAQLKEAVNTNIEK